MKAPKLAVAVYDLHYPLVDAHTVAAIMDFLKHNKVDTFIFGGDQFNFDCISHHTKNKPLYRQVAGYTSDIEGFAADIMQPLEKVIKGAQKVWIIGNHERFEHDLIEEQPELKGTIDHVKALRLREKGWKVIPLGHAYVLGKLNVIHGEVLSGIGNQAGAYPAKKAVELYGGNVLAGHTHSMQQYVKVSPVDQRNKWSGTVSPIAGDINPAYLRNRPSAWVNGFTIIEYQANGNFNLYPIVVSDGRFSYGGKLYGGRL